MKTEVLNDFEKLSLHDKIEFLDEHDLVNDLRNRDHFIEFIKTLGFIKDQWFQALAIDAASELQINDDKLFEDYFSFLLSPSHYLVKLSVLDFQLDTFDCYYPRKRNLFTQLEKLLKKRSERLIVKNQVLLNLMVFQKENRLRYQKILLVNLKRTSDYRSHLRVYNTLMNYALFDFITHDFVFEIISISEKWNFGKSIHSKISQVKEYFA